MAYATAGEVAASAASPSSSASAYGRPFTCSSVPSATLPDAPQSPSHGATTASGAGSIGRTPVAQRAGEELLQATERSRAGRAPRSKSTPTARREGADLPALQRGGQPQRRGPAGEPRQRVLGKEAQAGKGEARGGQAHRNRAPLRAFCIPCRRRPPRWLGSKRTASRASMSPCSRGACPHAPLSLAGEQTRQWRWGAGDCVEIFRSA